MDYWQCLVWRHYIPAPLISHKVLFVYCLDYFIDIINVNTCFYFDKIEVYNKMNITLSCCSVSLYLSSWLCRTVSHSCLWHSCTTNSTDQYKVTEHHANIIFRLYRSYDKTRQEISLIHIFSLKMAQNDLYI